jgi:thymidylate kinase
MARGARAVAGASRGTLIAVVGADGAGKSAAVDALCDSLSPNFPVARVHMGKPRWSWSTFPIKATLKLLRSSGLSVGWESAAEPLLPGRRVGLGWLAWHATTARDRYRTYRRARRKADGGALVICDRFPLPQIESMDGPRGDRFRAGSHSRLFAALARLERRYYARIGRPDLLLVLRVEPEVALRRRPEDPESRVRERAQEILEVDWRATGAHVFDANRPMAELHRELKSWIWKQL